MFFRRVLWTIVACSLLMGGLSSNRALGQQPWPVDGPYEPKHVYAAVAGAIHERLEIPIQGDPPYWLNVSTVGYPYDYKTDAGKIGLNLLANFMPPADGRLSTGKAGGLLTDLDRRLDRWYDYLLANIAFCYEDKPPHVKQAEARLFEIDAATGAIKRDSDGRPIRKPEYKNFRAAQKAFQQADLMKGVKDKGDLSAEESAKAQSAWIDASMELTDAGSDGIAAAAGILMQFTKRDGNTQNLERMLDVLTYRAKNTLEPGNQVPPLSYLIPPAETWADGSGWYEDSFSQTDSFGRYEKHIKRFSGGGGFNLGFVTIGGSGGKDEVTESRINKVQKFGYKFKLKRILIYRPWFDASLLEDRGWTWNEKKTGPFPTIARLPNADGSPVASADLFKTKSVGLALIPVQLILAKDLEVTCTVNKSEWEMTKTQTQIGGGGMFFGIIALKADSSNVDEKESTSATDVILTAKQPDVSIIGAISRVVTVAPVPNQSAGNWPESAWKPWQP